MNEEAKKCAGMNPGDRMTDEEKEALRKAWRAFYLACVKPYEQRHPWYDMRSVHSSAWKAFNRFLTIRLYGGACQCCGETTDRLLTLDHIKQNGKRPKGSWTDAFHAKHSGKFQILCIGCNHAKANAGDVECPHQAIRRIAAELSEHKNGYAT